MKKWIFATIAIVVLALVCIVGVAEEKVFIYARPVSKTIDPAPACADEEVQNCLLVYDTLVTLDEDLNMQPSLAESWEISADGKEYIFHLRKGVKFHDGTPFTAEAVKYSLDRLVGVGLQCMGTYSSMVGDNSPTVIDDYTVKVTLASPNPWLANDELIIPAAYGIVNPSYVKAHATPDDPWAEIWMANHANGTGPFKLDEWIPGERMVFVKNSECWDKDRIPKVDKLIFRIFKESSTARLWLERGEVDAAEKLTPDDFEALQAIPDVETRLVDYPLMIMLMMDVSRPPFDDLLVRKAIAYAINYDEIMDKAERGNAIRATSAAEPPGMLGYTGHPLPYRYVPEVAKYLLSLSSYPEGFSFDLNYALVRRAAFEEIALYLQAYLQEIGLDANLVNLSLAARNDLQKKGGYGITLMQNSVSRPSSDSSMGWLYDHQRGIGSGWTATFWDDPWPMGNLKKAREVFDLDARRDLYVNTDMAVSELLIYVPLYQAQKLIAVRKEVKNLPYTAFYFGRFWDADI